ncbi:MAG: lysophospholipid acyltransferase family protein [Gallionellaceae bacterium]|nr:lysophospholipid acyltransferase family protein [Gallionellaceae bacterium]
MFPPPNKSVVNVQTERPALYAETPAAQQLSLKRVFISLYGYSVLYSGLLLFGLICLSWSLPAGALVRLLPKQVGARLGQWVIMAGFRSYLFMLQTTGLVKLDLNALDTLYHERSLIIVTNHPSLIDVVLIASRLPRIVCIMKAGIWNNLLLGGGARLAGYIRNDYAVDMVRSAAAAAAQGNQLLIFPEGTRTREFPVNHFKGGCGLIAKKARAPIQTIFIETNSHFLGKGWPLLKNPGFPLIYRVKLGRRYAIPTEAKNFTAELEHYYRQQAGARSLTHE